MRTKTMAQYPPFKSIFCTIVKMYGVIGAASAAALCTAAGATFEVVNTAGGVGSLRQAISNSNTQPGPHTILFNIPGSGVQTISLGSPLPVISNSVVIDGYSQPGSSANTLAVGNNAALLIEIDGTFSGGTGLTLAGESNTVRGLVINRCSSAGIRIQGSYFDVISGNFIGTTPDGTAARANGYGILLDNASGTRIGGETPAERNLLSGNTANGIRIGNLNFDDWSVNISVSGNYVGTDKSGLTSLPNRSSGISVATGANIVIGGTVPSARNVISGNGSHGVHFYYSENNDLLGNYIGLTANGAMAMGNMFYGVLINGGFQNRIGGLAEGAGNFIQFNGNAGVYVFDGEGHAILGNSIYRNLGRGIDLSPSDVTTNDLGDADVGPNDLQNFPVLTSVEIGTNVIVTGTLNSVPLNLFLLQFFGSDFRDFSGYGEGEAIIGSGTVTTSDTGDSEFAFVFPFPGNAKGWITATATDLSGNTSEFSMGLRATASTVPYIAEQPTSLVVTQGSNVTFTVEAGGMQPLSYQWRFNDTNIVFATNPTVVLTNVQLASQGSYRAAVSNSFGIAQSDSATLTVYAKPEILQQPQGQIAVQGDTVTFRVVAIANPNLLTYQWRFNSSGIAGKTNATMTLTNAQSGQAGNYSVVLRNSIGFALSSNAVLTVLADSDGDHIPDLYESMPGIGLNPNDPADAALDFDGDGMTNLQEYRAGTDPHDSSSFLKIDRVWLAANEVHLEFVAVSNRTYSVVYKSSLDTPFWTKLADVSALATNRIAMVTDTPPSAHRYYRLATPQQP